MGPLPRNAATARPSMAERAWQAVWAWILATWTLIAAFFASLVASPRDYQQRKGADDDGPSDKKPRYRSLRDLPPACGPTS